MNDTDASCPHCSAPLTLREVLEVTDVCWPYKRWARGHCAQCGDPIYLLPGFEKLTLGTIDTTSDATFVPHRVLEPWDYSCWWSAGGLRLSLGDERWTIRASDLLW